MVLVRNEYGLGGLQKIVMNFGGYVFSRTLKQVNRYEFGKCVKGNNGDHRALDSLGDVSKCPQSA